MTKPFQAGHGAESGLASVELVALGWKPPNRFWKRIAASFMLRRFLRPSAILNHLGKPWTFPLRRLAKTYPSGSLAHPAMNGDHAAHRSQRHPSRTGEKVDIALTTA